VLKKRIIPVQLLLDGRLVKTRQFGAYRDVGDPVASSRVYNAQNADELCS
jgi:cyclase